MARTIPFANPIEFVDNGTIANSWDINEALEEVHPCKVTRFGYKYHPITATYTPDTILASRQPLNFLRFDRCEMSFLTQAW